MPTGNDATRLATGYTVTTVFCESCLPEAMDGIDPDVQDPRFPPDEQVCDVCGKDIEPWEIEGAGVS